MESPTAFLIPIASKTHISRALEPSRLARELLERAGVKVFGLTEPVVEIDEIPKFPAEEYDVIVMFIASGGSSGLGVKISRRLPCFIWAYDKLNSLSSALSVREKLKSLEAWRGEIVYNSLEEAPPQIIGRAKASWTLRLVNGTKLGLIGDDEYFKDKAEDADALSRLFGVKVVNISVDDFLTEFACQAEEDALKILENKFSAATLVEPSKKECLKAAKMYLALKSLIEKTRVDAVTLDCFKVIRRTGTAACMALSLLNDEGKVAICEGDLEAGALMLIFHKLTGQSWMGNLAQVSRDLNAITLAHCTAATSLAELGGKIFLRSHFESDESVALDVPLKRQHATIANLQFKPLQIVVARGEVTESQIGKFSLCRTQARIRLIGDVETLLKNTGNHHVLAYGDWSEALSQIGQKLGLSVVTA